MIARERRIVRRGDEQMCIARMSDVRPRTLPDVGDELSRRKSECGTYASRDDAMASVDRSPFAPPQEQHSEQRDKKYLAL